eukprot:gene212-4458_t
MKRRQSFFGFFVPKETLPKYHSDISRPKTRSFSFINTIPKIEKFDENNFTIEKTMKRNDHKNEIIPVILKHCFVLMNKNEKYFEEEGLDKKIRSLILKGLFRVSRGKKIIDEYKTNYFEYPNFDELYNKLEKENDSILYTSLIRNILNSLTDPIMGYCSKGCLYNIMKLTYKDEKQFVLIAKKELKKLSKTRKSILTLLFYLLKKTHDHNEKMNADNLGKIMAMGLCHYSKNPSTKEIANLEKFNTTVTIMILKYENIFDVSLFCYSNCYLKRKRKISFY